MPQAQQTYGASGGSSQWDFGQQMMGQVLGDEGFGGDPDIWGGHTNLSELLQDDSLDQSKKESALQWYLGEQNQGGTPGEGWSEYVSSNYMDLVNRVTAVDQDILGDFEFKMQSNIEDAYEGMYGESLAQEQQMSKSGFASSGGGFFDVDQFDLDEVSRGLESERLGYRESVYDYHDELGADFWNYVNMTTGS